MSGHRSFAELTREFTAERWQRVAEKRAELDNVSLSYMSPTEKKRIFKMRESSVSFYRSSQSSHLRKPTSRPPRQHMFTLWTQPAELMSPTRFSTRTNSWRNKRRDGIAPTRCGGIKCRNTPAPPDQPRLPGVSAAHTARR